MDPTSEAGGCKGAGMATTVIIHQMVKFIVVFLQEWITWIILHQMDKFNIVFLQEWFSTSETGGYKWGVISEELCS